MICANIIHIFAVEANDSAFVARMNNIEVSVLTCQPHDEIYSLYGHTALRINDRNTGEDLAINYGVFDTTKDFFVLRFIFGLTDYMMAAYSFTDFLVEYRYYGSGVYQQVINLNPQEKLQLLHIIAENSKPENVTYRYNFYYDNCTTRIRDIIDSAVSKGGVIRHKDHREDLKKLSFRKLIHAKNGEHPWARFGNDLLLGVGSDMPLEPFEDEFIPDVLMSHLDEETISRYGENKKIEEVPLVSSASWVLEPGTPYHPTTIDFPLTPNQTAIAFLCAILSLIAIRRKLKKDYLWMQFALLSVYWIVGVVLTLMLFSEHPTVKVNLQILICNPLIFYFTFPKTKFKWRWMCVLILCLLFFLGNVIQSYADGMNIMALALFLIAADNISKCAAE